MTKSRRPGIRKVSVARVRRIKIPKVAKIKPFKRRRPSEHQRRVRFGPQGRYRKRTLINKGIRKIRMTFGSDITKTTVLPQESLAHINKTVEKADEKIDALQEHIPVLQAYTTKQAAEEALRQQEAKFDSLRAKLAAGVEQKRLDQQTKEMNALADISKRVEFEDENKKKMANLAIGKEQLSLQRLAARVNMAVHSVEQEENEIATRRAKKQLMMLKREMDTRKRAADDLLEKMRQQSSWSGWDSFAADNWTSWKAWNNTWRGWKRVTEDI